MNSAPLNRTRTSNRRRLINASTVLLLLCGLSLLSVLLAPSGRRAGAPPDSDAASEFSTAPHASPASPATPLTVERAREVYGRMELSFEANRGQADASVDFLARGVGYTLFLKPEEAVFLLSRKGATGTRADAGRELKAATGEAAGSNTARNNSTDARADKRAAAEPAKTLGMKLVGARAGASVEGADELAGKVNYFKGDDPAKWRTNVPTFGRVRYSEVYPGIDVVYYGNQRQLEYDFVVAPGGDARAVSLKFDGADKIEIDAAGDLLLTVGGETVRQLKPVLYQEAAGGERRTVEGAYALQPDGRVGFRVGEYDAERPLVIDPILVYSTYLGGSDFEDGSDIKVDSSGHAYICGQTSSTNFPTANAIQPTFGGATFEGGRDGFITKLNTTGSGFVYSTYLGGNGDDVCNKIAVDSTGNAYVAGETTSSTNFPRANAYQNTFGGGLSDAFITKLNAEGNTLVFSTYLGGSIFDAASGIALDSSNNVYITGRTTSADFPTANAIQATQAGQFADAFVTKFNAAGNALVYSTYLGGSDGTEGGFDAGFSIAVDSDGGAYVTGQTRSTNFPAINAVQSTFGGGFPDGDAFVTKVNAQGTAFAYSTYLGGSANDIGFEIAVDSANSAYVSGVVRSTNFPTANAFQSTLNGTSDAFMTKFSPDGTSFVYSTYFGGNGDDSANGIAVSAGNEPYLAIGTSSTDLPTVNPTQAASGGGIDAFIARFNAGGSALIYSTYLGGTGTDAGLSIALDPALSIYLVGRTASTNFPTLNPVRSTNGGGQDAFITKIALDPPATPTPTATATPTPTATATPTPTPTPLTVQFSAAAYEVSEGAGSVLITVSRAGDNSAAATVEYATTADSITVGCNVVNGIASERCDYTTTLGTLRFAAGETSKAIRVFITDDVYLDGTETFTLSLSNPTGELALGTPAAATVTIADNDTNPSAPNPIDTAQFFVSMHYIDFLNRQGEPSGISAWTNALNNCPAGNTACDRVGVSASFFRAEEFMLKGFFVIRFYKVSLGPPPSYRQFTRDSQRVTADTAAEVTAAREAFTNEWVQRADFKAIYDGLTNQQYVDKLEQTAGVTLANKAALVAALDGGTKTRAQVLREIVESQEVRRRMYHDAFVLMEYYGYLRRDPEPAGFNAWLNYLNANPGDWRTMVRGFVNSVEYRKRFGEPGAPQPG